MSKTWFAVGPDAHEHGWYAIPAETKFDAIWKYYQEHGAPAPGSERINAEIVPQWQGKSEITEDDWRGTGYQSARPCEACGASTANHLDCFMERGRFYCYSCYFPQADDAPLPKISGASA